MALAIDSSSPALATNTNDATIALTTASFNPPAGSLLVIRWSGNSLNGVTPTAPTITDNLGAGTLTYTQVSYRSRANDLSSNGQNATWWAVVGAGGSMTVTVNNNAGSGGRSAALEVIVLTGQDPVDPIGAGGGATSTSAGSIAQSYTAESTGGWGFLSVCDWDDLGAMTAGSGCTFATGGTASLPGQISYGFASRTSADDVNGVSNSLNVTIGGTSTNLQYTWVEVNPDPNATSDPASPQYTQIPPHLLIRFVMANAEQYSSALGAAPEIFAESGTAFASLGGYADAVKVVAQTGVGSVGIAPHGPTQGVRAQTGRCAVGVAAHATAVHVGAPVARSVVGLAGVGTAAKKMAATGVSAIGMVARATETKTATPASRALVGIQGRSTVVKRATPVSTASFGISAYAAAVKKMAATGSACIGFGPDGPTQGQRVVTARCSFGLQGRASVGHIASPVARAVVGVQGRGTQAKRAEVPGLAALGATLRATVAKRSTPTGYAALGATPSGVARHIAPRAGVSSLGLSGNVANGKRLPQSGRAFVGVSAQGTIFEPVAIDRDAGPIRLRNKTGQIGLAVPDQGISLRSNGNIWLQEAEGSQ